MKQAGDPVFFKNAAARVLGATALLVFYVNMSVFDLYIELLIQPFILLLLRMSAAAESRSDLAPVKRLTDWTLGLVGVGITVYVTTRLAQNWNDIDHSETLRALFLPVWLTLGILPLIYLLALLSAYRVTLVGARSSLDRRAVPWRVRLAIITSFHVRLAELESLNWGSLREIAAAMSFREARQKIAGFRQAQRSADRSISVPAFTGSASLRNGNRSPATANAVLSSTARCSGRRGRRVPGPGGACTGRAFCVGLS